MLRTRQSLPTGAGILTSHDGLHSFTTQGSLVRGGSRETHVPGFPLVVWAPARGGSPVGGVRGAATGYSGWLPEGCDPRLMEHDGEGRQP